MSTVEELKELAKLKSTGMLTEAQFEAAKNKVIGNNATASAAASSGSASAGKPKQAAAKGSKKESGGWDFDGDF